MLVAGTVADIRLPMDAYGAFSGMTTAAQQFRAVAVGLVVDQRFPATP